MLASLSLDPSWLEVMITNPVTLLALTFKAKKKQIWLRLFNEDSTMVCIRSLSWSISLYRLSSHSLLSTKANGDGATAIFRSSCLSATFRLSVAYGAHNSRSSNGACTMNTSKPSVSATVTAVFGKVFGFTLSRSILLDAFFLLAVLPWFYYHWFWRCPHGEDGRIVSLFCVLLAPRCLLKQGK